MKQIFSLLPALILLAVLLTGCTDTQSPVQTDDSHTDSESQASGSQTGQDSQQAETPPEISVLEEREVTLFLPDEQAEFFVEQTETVDATPQGIIDALIAHGALPEGIEVNEFRLEDSGPEAQADDSSGHAAGGRLHIVLDLSDEFLSAVASAGTAGETMAMGSLVNTMLTAYEAGTITVTCSGNTIETGHNVYDAPLTFFELENGSSGQ